MNKINFTKDEIHEMHMALGELLDFFKRSRKHKEFHKEGCDICDGYEKLRKRFLKQCDCIENTRDT